MRKTTSLCLVLGRLIREMAAVGFDGRCIEWQQPAGELDGAAAAATEASAK